MGRTKFLFQRQLLALALRIPLILAGLLFGGMIGALTGRIVSALLTYGISLFLTKGLLDLTVRQQVQSNGMTFVGLLVMCTAVRLADAMLHSVFAADPVIALLVLGGTGAIAFCSCVLLLWLARGRPDGAVAEIVGIASGLLSILRPKAIAGQ